MEHERVNEEWKGNTEREWEYKEFLKNLSLIRREQVVAITCFLVERVS